MNRKYYSLLLIVCLALGFASCDDDGYEVPKGKTALQNDCIKRSLGPNIVGGEIEFAYAMALGKGYGTLVSAKVEASIAGASDTYLEHRSYHTGNDKNDVGVVVGSPSVTEGKTTQVTFVVDTCAATLRYYYVIPEEARGKSVSFTFSATDSNGKTVSYKMGQYGISNMDMKLDIVLTDNSYFSIVDMETYTDLVAANDPNKVDVIYLYRRLTNVDFLHTLVAPSADEEYRPDVILPAGANNNTPLLRTYNAIDQQLARDQYGVFIDDLDFQRITFDNAPDFAVNMKKDAGVWTETADGQYRAFIYVNAVNNVKKEMTVSVKRLKVK